MLFHTIAKLCQAKDMKTIVKQGMIGTFVPKLKMKWANRAAALIVETNNEQAALACTWLEFYRTEKTMVMSQTKTDTKFAT